MKAVEIILLIYAVCVCFMAIWLIATRKTTDGKFSWIILATVLSPFLLLLLLLRALFKHLGTKPYQHYFDKSDTPYVQSFQPNRKYHVVWKRCAYTMFLKHQVVKVKFLGLFTIYKKEVSK